VHTRLDETIREKIQRRFAEHYAGLHVSLHSAQRIDGQGIELRGLTISDPAIPGDQGVLLHLDEMLLVCNASLEELIAEKLKVSQIIVRRPTLRATRGPDGAWNAARLLPLPKFGPTPPLGPESPTTRIEGGTVHLIDASTEGRPILTFRDVRLDIAPQRKPADVVVGDPALEFSGSLAGKLMQQIDLRGTFHPLSSRWHLTGEATGLKISPEVSKSLPGELAQSADVLRGLHGEGHGEFQVSYEPTRPVPLEFDVRGQFVNGRLEDPRLPRPITDIQASLRLNNAGLTIDELSATSGASTLTLQLHRQGYAANSPLSLTAAGRNLAFDQIWLPLLPESWRNAWYKFYPAGQFDADVELSYDGQTWTPHVQLRCLDVSFSYYRFPYKVERTTGLVKLDGPLLSLQLQGYAGTQPVQISGECRHPGPEAAFRIELRGKGLAINDQLLDAMPGKSAEVIRSLEPRGTVDFLVRTERRQVGEQAPDQHAVVDLNRCSLRYEKFPIPIDNITGALELRNGHWTFRDLHGTHGASEIRGTGWLQAPEAGGLFQLRITGRRVVLGDELRSAMPPDGQQLWRDFRLQGTANLLVDLIYQPQHRHLSLMVRAEPVGTLTSIEPSFFPYAVQLVERGIGEPRLSGQFTRPLEELPRTPLAGTVLYRDGLFLPDQSQATNPLVKLVEFNALKATHGATTAQASGRCQLRADGTWRAELFDAAVDRVHLDRDNALVQALPEGLRKAVLALRPTGATRLSGRIEFASRLDHSAPVTAQWDADIDVQQGKLDCGVRLDNLYGGLRKVRGWYDGQTFQSAGELYVDSLTYEDYQLTQIRGPLLITPQEVVLGDWRKPAPGMLARHATARMFGGHLTGDVRVKLLRTPQFTLRAQLERGDLERLAQERVRGQTALKGKMYGNLELSGDATGINSLAGGGQITLRDADIYELPVMVALLKILSVRLPDATGFTSSDIAFTLKANHLYFSDISFKGDAVSLHGKGEMDLDQNIALTFYATVGRGDLPLPLVNQIVGRASEQLMLIHVGGTLSSPQVRQEAFPNITRALGQVQDAAGEPAASGNVLPTAADLLDPLRLLRRPRVERATR